MRHHTGLKGLHLLGNLIGKYLRGVLSGTLRPTGPFKKKDDDRH